MPIVEIVLDLDEFLDKVDDSKPVHQDVELAFQAGTDYPIYMATYRLYGVARKDTAFNGQIIMYENKHTDIRPRQLENCTKIETAMNEKCKAKKIKPTGGRLIFMG